ncbi:MAG: type II secretion system major pseudopilin GspG [Gammaproteobacteria bacterium]
MENHALSELRTNSVKDHSAYLAAFRDYGAAIAKARRVIKDYPSTPSAMKLTQTDSRIGAYTLSELEETIIPRMGQMAWTMAAGRGDIEIVRGLLKEGIGRNAEGNGGPYKGFTALHAAAAGGSVEIIKLLLKVGADPNGVGESSADGGGEYTPLTEAAAEGHAEIVKVLLEAGADPKSKASNTYGLTALGHALQGGHGDIVKMLVAAGANLTNAPSDMHSATFLAAVEGGFADIVGRLLKAGAHPDSCAGYQCMTKALLAAAERGHTEIVKLLVSAGANLDVVAGWGAGAGPEPTALGLALQHGHADIVALLKKAGAKVVSRETTTTDNITYAMKSTTIDDPKAVSVLLEKVREKGMGTHQSLRQGLDRFRQDVGRYPTTDEGFQALSERPPNIDPCKWNGSYVFDAQKQDPWGREYHYKSPGEHREYDLYSLGADNAEGGDGENADIVSWKKDGAVRPLQRSK